MKTISLVVRRSSERLQLKLEQKGESPDQSPFQGCWSDCGSSGKMVSLTQGKAAGETLRRAFEEEIAFHVAQFIVEDLSMGFLQDLLRFHYYYFSRKEREEILANARKNFENNKFKRRRELYRVMIAKSIGLYLNEGRDHLNIEGFYSFRLTNWRRELGRLIDEAVEKYFAEKEYREFVRLLKYFLNLQQPKIEMIHLSVDQKGSIQITDDRLRQIDPCDWEEFDLADIYEENDYEDILVSMLVSVAPRRIMVHRGVALRFPRATESLRSIFEKRLIYCENCSYCRREKAPLVTGDSSPHPTT